MVERSDDEFNILVGDIEFHSACSTYRFFPAFFIRAAYATFARSDAALRMTALHLGRLRA